MEAAAEKRGRKERDPHQWEINLVSRIPDSLVVSTGTGGMGKGKFTMTGVRDSLLFFLFARRVMV